MSAFSLAFTQFFATLAAFFNAFEKLGKTIDNVASVAEQSSGMYRKEAEFNLASKDLELSKKLADQRKQLALE